MNIFHTLFSVSIVNLEHVICRLGCFISKLIFWYRKSYYSEFIMSEGALYWEHWGDKRRYFYVSGEGNLIFCCTAVGRIVTGRLVVKIIIILNFRVGTSKNKDIDHQVRHLYTSYIWNRPHMYSVIQQLFFYVFHCDLKEKYIRRNTKFQKRKVCMWNQYFYYFDLSKIRVGRLFRGYSERHNEVAGNILVNKQFPLSNDFSVKTSSVTN